MLSKLLVVVNYSCRFFRHVACSSEFFFLVYFHPLSVVVVFFSSMAGVSRSTSLVAAYIMVVTQLDWREALEAIKCARSIANPNYGFKRQLQDFCNLQAPQERERLKREFPNSKFDDEKYLREIMANSMNNDDLEDRADDVMDALCRHTQRTKIQSYDKENEETIDSIGEETSPNTAVEN